MGEASRRAARRKEFAKSVKPLTRHRFDLYTIGTRKALARLMSAEVSYWASIDEALLGMIFLDTTDKDFMWMVLARDRAGRFRCIEVSKSFKSVQMATDMLHERMAQLILAGNLGEIGFQADEPNAPFDLLRVEPDTDPEKLHPSFRILLESPGREPARAVIPPCQSQ